MTGMGADVSLPIPLTISSMRTSDQAIQRHLRTVYRYRSVARKACDFQEYFAEELCEGNADWNRSSHAINFFAGCWPTRLLVLPRCSQGHSEAYKNKHGKQNHV